MASEADFRRAVDLALRGHAFCVYMSTMTREGVPDLYVVVNGRSHWLELKAFDAWPRSATADVLDHHFSHPQLVFLRRVDGAQTRGWGLVGHHENRRWECWLLRIYDLEAKLTREDLERHPPLIVSAPNFVFELVTMLDRG